MEYKKALEIAEKVKQELKPHCERIEIAGSIRRKKPEVKDIEIVAIPKSNRDELTNIVNKWEKVRGDVSGKYTQRILPEGITLDLFFATEENWGSILLIRTGDWEFSKKFVGSIMPRAGYKQKDGYVWKDGKIIPIFGEEELFKLVNVPYIGPPKRDKNAI